MDKKTLLISAGNLKKVSDSAYSEYNIKGDQLVAKMNELMLKRPDLLQLIGEGNVDMMKDNHANHVRFIASVLKNYHPEVLLDTVLWVFRAYRSHGFTTNYWAAQLNAWIIILKESLSVDTFNEIYPLYEWMQINIPLFVKLSDQQLSASNSLH
ncbi:MAG: hypothetical protein VB046_01625 [Paludibacter sp.]|jgi:hypothetical protein|nr:hypothetical protein [Paludibacter sp.]